MADENLRGASGLIFRNFAKYDTHGTLTEEELLSNRRHSLPCHPQARDRVLVARTDAIHRVLKRLSRLKSAHIFLSELFLSQLGINIRTFANHYTTKFRAPLYTLL